MYCKILKDEKYRRQEREDMQKAVLAARNNDVALVSHAHCSKTCPRKTLGCLAVENTPVTSRVGAVSHFLRLELYAFEFNIRHPRWHVHARHIPLLSIAVTTNIHIF